MMLKINYPLNGDTRCEALGGILKYMFNNKLTFLEQFLGKSKYSSNTKEAEFYCCFCAHHKPKLSINLEIMAYKCWVCGQSGRSFSYLLHKCGASTQEIKEFEGKFGQKRTKNNHKVDDIDVFRPKLPSNFIPILPNLDSFFGKRAFNYLTRTRKIFPDDILRHKIGYTTDGKYKDAIIFPSFDKKGYLNYFTARFFDNFKLSPQTPRGYKNQIVINELNIDWTKPVVITEGPVDMLKSIPNTVPLFGSTCSVNSKLFRMIVSHETSVILGLDADAQEKSNRLANSFMRYDVSVYNMDMGSYNDLGEMSKEEARLRYENAKIFTVEDVLRSKLRAIC